jgi:hypothetical protein
MYSTTTRRSFSYTVAGCHRLSSSLRSLHAVNTEAAASSILLKNVRIFNRMNIDVLRVYERNILVIIKDGKVYKNTLSN